MNQKYMYCRTSRCLELQRGRAIVLNPPNAIKSALFRIGTKDVPSTNCVPQPPEGKALRPRGLVDDHDGPLRDPYICTCRTWRRVARSRMSWRSTTAQASALLSYFEDAPFYYEDEFRILRDEIKHMVSVQMRLGLVKEL